MRRIAKRLEIRDEWGVRDANTLAPNLVLPEESGPWWQRRRGLARRDAPGLVIRNDDDLIEPWAR
jgi:hypothetical protein